MARLNGMAVGLLLLAGPLMFAACGDSSTASGVQFPRVATLGDCKICPEIRNTALAVGPNRVIIALSDEHSRPILDAQVHARFYDRNGDKPALTDEEDATFEPVQLAYVNEDAGRQTTVTGNDGVYIVNTTFSRSGDWGVFLDVRRGSEQLRPIPFTFSVRDKTSEPAIGATAFASRQPTLSNVADIAEIDSSYPARPAMHTTTIADALQSGKPVVVAFATPAFCDSRLCAPIMNTVMDPLAEQYAGRASFIHVEPYDLKARRETGQQLPVSAAREWGIESEPWIFVVDGQGKISAKFEGVASAGEVRAALDRALAGTPAAAGSTTAH